MDTTIASDATVAPDGSAILFEIVAHGRVVQCSVERDALEQYFWLPIGASETRLLKAFGDGQKRIIAAAERKALKSAAGTIDLQTKDFAR
jgi:Protein of unknown function (DUF1488)